MLGHPGAARAGPPPLHASGAPMPLPLLPGLEAASASASGAAAASAAARATLLGAASGSAAVADIWGEGGPKEAVHRGGAAPAPAPARLPLHQARLLPRQGGAGAIGGGAAAASAAGHALGGSGMAEEAEDAPGAPAPVPLPAPARLLPRQGGAGASGGAAPPPPLAPGAPPPHKRPRVDGILTATTAAAAGSGSSSLTITATTSTAPSKPSAVDPPTCLRVTHVLDGAGGAVETLGITNTIERGSTLVVSSDCFAHLGPLGHNGPLARIVFDRKGLPSVQLMTVSAGAVYSHAIGLSIQLHQGEATMLGPTSRLTLRHNGKSIVFDIVVSGPSAATAARGRSSGGGSGSGRGSGNWGGRGSGGGRGGGGVFGGV